MPRLGVFSRLYVNSNGLYNAPNWLEVDLVSELQNNANWNEGESSVRRGRTVTMEQTNLVLELTGTVRKELSANAAFAVMNNAFMNATALDIMVLDGSRFQNGSNGFRYWSRIFNWSEDQSLPNVIYKAFTIKPCAWGEPSYDAQGNLISNERPKQVNIIGFVPIFTDIGAE